MNTPESVIAVPFSKRKKTYSWALLGVGLLHGALHSYGLSHPPSQMGLQLFMSFTFNLALLGWCYADAQQRMIPITQFLGLALLAVAIVGVPWYFVRSRGLLGALKGAFGLGLFLLWFVGFLVAAITCEAATGNLGG